MEYRSERGNFEHTKGTGNPSRLQVGEQVELGRGEAERGYHPDSSVDRENPSQPTGNIYVQIYILDIFDREPTHQDFIFGRNSSVYGIQRNEVLGLN